MADELAIEDMSTAELAKKLLAVNASLEKQIDDLKIELEVKGVHPEAPLKDLPCFAPFKRPDGRIITSSVIQNTTEWYEVGFLIPHESIRRDIIEVEYLLKRHVKFDEPWKLVNFFNWYEGRFVKIIITHHDGEEKIFFPWVKKRCPLPDKTSADHKTLMKLLGDISDIGKNFKKNGGNPTNIEAAAVTLPLLTAKWEEMKSHMFPHLAEEEEQFVTFIKDKFTKKETDAIIQVIIKKEGISGAKRFVPSVLESIEMWGTATNQADFRKELPPPIRFILRKSWKYSYEKYHRGALNSLRAGAPKVLIEEKSWF